MQHYIFNCPSYSHKRWAMLKQCSKCEPKLKDVLNCAEMVLPIANYIQAMGRFEMEKAGEKEMGRGEGRGAGRGAGMTQDSQLDTPRDKGPDS